MMESCMILKQAEYKAMNKKKYFFHQGYFIPINSSRVKKVGQDNKYESKNTSVDPIHARLNTILEELTTLREQIEVPFSDIPYIYVHFVEET
jgi:hypothetical protein